ncbi:type II toxin-antitoxin system Phd/YefM family antitoxin [Solimicrobium silvestre]|uniref:Antitoxin n=1 Tax=Solimicrobium silvestre TaxID=2099400 RepID=A0A2S9H227_9BURK|nr:type II toxin-antitoxin system prevent-host-death family antitoxin [Solimicrobium silvestre]PRC94029.1 Prevent-host-death family protein [Solimicrobium silvestre]
MRILTYSEARNNLKKVLDNSIDDADVTIIHRRDGEDAVVMGLNYYNSLIETLHLTSSPSNAAHLAESIAEYRAGKAVQRKLIATDE